MVQVSDYPIRTFSAMHKFRDSYEGRESQQGRSIIF